MKYLIISLIIITVIFPVQKSSAQKSLNIFSIEVPPEIDGIYEPEKWLGADSASMFVQMEPQPGEQSAENTVVYIGQTNENIYVVFKCYQKAPVIAKNQSRDALSKNDDIVTLILDSYNDNRSGYAFFVNPLSTQYEMKLSDDGRSIDLNWDTEWKCAAKIYDWGWCAELEIPFKSIKYKKGTDIWGINFGRVLRSNFETSYWSGQLTDDFRVSQGGIAKGIQTPGSQMKLAILPYFSVFKIADNKLDADAGGDIIWQISPNVSLNSTINPDFATVEADQQRINLTRYELNYPEKRFFFQEGNDIYNTRIKTFYSRRIQDIDFGNRLNGKIGKTQFNILNVRTPDISDENPATWYTAARAKIDFLKSSSLGLTLVDKSWDDGFTRSVSLDYNMSLAKTWQLTGQFVGSAPGDFWSHSAWYLRFARENNIWHYHVRYSQIGDDFRETVNQTGFVTDDDRREIDSDITYKWWLKNNTFEFIDFQSMNNIFWSMEGTLRSWYFTDAVNFYFKNKLNFEYAYNNEYKLYEKDFYNNRHSFTVGYNTEQWTYGLINFTKGRNFDRDFTLFTGEARLKLFHNLSVTYSANVLNFTPDPNENSTFINVVTANYNFNPDLWLKLFAQNSTQNGNIYFYSLFGWRFKPPFGALYLIYSHDEYAVGTGLPVTNNFFVKVTYPITILK